MFQIVKMSHITVINNSADEIHVSITLNNEKPDVNISDEWRDIPANGGSNTWKREHLQVIRYTRSLTPGAKVETILGVPDSTVPIP